MKASEIIADLQKKIDKYGDRRVLIKVGYVQPDCFYEVVNADICAATNRTTDRLYLDVDLI